MLRNTDYRERREFAFNLENAKDILEAFGKNFQLTRDHMVDIRPYGWKEAPNAWALTAFLNTKELAQCQDELFKAGYLTSENYAQKRIYIHPVTQEEPANA